MSLPLQCIYSPGIQLATAAVFLSLAAAFQGAVQARWVCPQLRESLNCLKNAHLPDVNRGDLTAETGLVVVAHTQQAMVACLTPEGVENCAYELPNGKMLRSCVVYTNML